MRRGNGSGQGQGAVFTVLWVVFFVHGMVPGFWVPALTNILNANGMQGWVAAAFTVPPLCAMISPLIGGALADQRMTANNLYVHSSLLSGVFLAAAFGALQAGWHPLWFLSLLGLQSLCAAPGWSLLATIAMGGLRHPTRGFPLVRVGATVGWVAAGLAAGFWLGLDTSPWSGQLAAGVRVASAFLGLLLPVTPPLGRATTWASRMGFDAFRLLRRRNTAVLFGVALVFSIPLTALYMYSPEFLLVLGDPHPTGTMTVAQVLEIVFLLVLGSILARFSVKSVVLWALGLSVLRYGMSGVAGIHGGIAWHIAGVGLHGACYVLFFITAQIFLERAVEPGLRNQAQGLLAVVTGGLGPLLGAWLCAWLKHVCVTPDGRGWDLFWFLLGAVIAGCFVVFAMLYQRTGRTAVLARKPD